MLPVPAALSSIPNIPKKFIGKYVDVAEVNQRGCLEESGQWLENVDGTHLALACGKLVLQKYLSWHSTEAAFVLSTNLGLLLGAPKVLLKINILVYQCERCCLGIEQQQISPPPPSLSLKVSLFCLEL